MYNKFGTEAFDTVEKKMSKQKNKQTENQLKIRRKREILGMRDFSLLLCESWFFFEPEDLRIDSNSTIYVIEFYLWCFCLKEENVPREYLRI